MFAQTSLNLDHQAIASVYVVVWCCYKSSYLISQDRAEVNLYGIAARYIVTVVNKKIYLGNCHAIPML